MTFTVVLFISASGRATILVKMQQASLTPSADKRDIAHNCPSV